MYSDGRGDIERARAEVDAARRSGNRVQEANALAKLGSAHLRNGEPEKAIQAKSMSAKVFLADGWVNDAAAQLDDMSGIAGEELGDYDACRMLAERALDVAQGDAKEYYRGQLERKNEVIRRRTS